MILWEAGETSPLSERRARFGWEQIPRRRRRQGLWLLMALFAWGAEPICSHPIR